MTRCLSIRFPVVLLIGMIACLIHVTGQESTNRVLDLDGDGDYVRLPSDIFNELDQATVEGLGEVEATRELGSFL